MKKEAYSRPFNLVVENKYPNLLIGPGFYKTFSSAKKSDPKNWGQKKIEEVDSQRKTQEFAFKEFDKKEAVNPRGELDNIQWISQSVKTTEFEIDVDSKKKLIVDKVTGVKNNSFSLNNLKITENIRVPKTIDRVTNDTSLHAKDGILELYSKTKDVYKIEQLLSIGLLGVKRNRVFVPTRWAITSIDDIVGKDIIDNLRLNQTIDDFQLFNFTFLKNKFYVLLLPYPWGFEMIENQNSSFTVDYEMGTARKEYAKNVTGAYYAARLEVAEYLKLNKRQGMCIVFRDIDVDYYSRGVWVIREAIRLALKNNPLRFESQEELFKYLDDVLKIKNTSRCWKEQSNLLKNIKVQKRIFEF